MSLGNQHTFLSPNFFICKIEIPTPRVVLKVQWDDGYEVTCIVLGTHEEHTSVLFLSFDVSKNLEKRGKNVFRGKGDRERRKQTLRGLLEDNEEFLLTSTGSHCPRGTLLVLKIRLFLFFFYLLSLPSTKI